MLLLKYTPDKSTQTMPRGSIQEAYTDWLNARCPTCPRGLVDLYWTSLPPRCAQIITTSGSAFSSIGMISFLYSLKSTHLPTQLSRVFRHTAAIRSTCNLQVMFSRRYFYVPCTSHQVLFQVNCVKALMPCRPPLQKFLQNFSYA